MKENLTYSVARLTTRNKTQGQIGVISNSNWTEWSTIQGVIGRVISTFEITSPKLLLNHNHYNFLKCDWCINCYILHYRSSYFVNHSYDYRPNWTPLSPITIINRNYNKIRE